VSYRKQYKRWILSEGIVHCEGFRWNFVFALVAISRVALHCIVDKPRERISSLRLNRFSNSNNNSPDNQQKQINYYFPLSSKQYGLRFCVCEHHFHQHQSEFTVPDPNQFSDHFKNLLDQLHDYHRSHPPQKFKFPFTFLDQTPPPPPPEAAPSSLSAPSGFVFFDPL